MAQAFIGVIVQIQVRDFDVARGQRIRIHAESVILRGDFHLPGQQILHRMIRAVMAELQLEGFSAQSQSAQAGVPGKFRTPERWPSNLRIVSIA